MRYKGSEWSATGKAHQAAKPALVTSLSTSSKLIRKRVRAGVKNAKAKECDQGVRVSTSIWANSLHEKAGILPGGERRKMQVPMSADHEEHKPDTDVVASLLEAFPDFAKRGEKYVASWGGEASGSYVDMAGFVNFVVEDLNEKGNLDETKRAFQFLEQLLTGATQRTRDLIGLGFFETLRNFASWRPGGNEVYEQFLGPISKQIWGELQVMWTGKSNLMDVIRAERKNNSKS
jgi:hypothetical protein